MENTPSSPKEPSPKKLKMSVTTTSDEDIDNATGKTINGEATTAPKKFRYKRRKVAIFFAYCGVGYQGMQKNPGAKTIEGDLQEALYHAGAVPEEDRGKHHRFDWARSARTDKGVSAVGQVGSGRFYVDPPGFIDRLNSNLPPQIRIFGYKRVTPSYNAKKFCDRRRYVYLLPVFALDPSCHRDRESVMASLGSGNELVKCLECSERGRKVFGIMGKRNFDSKTDSGEHMLTNDATAGGSESVITSGIDGATKIVSESDDMKTDSPEDVMQTEANGTTRLSSECKQVIDSSSVNANQVNLGSNTDSGLAREEMLIEEQTAVQEEKIEGQLCGSGEEKIEGQLCGRGNGEEKLEKQSEFKFIEEKTVVQEEKTEGQLCGSVEEKIEGQLCGSGNGEEKLEKESEFKFIEEQTVVQEDKAEGQLCGSGEEKIEGQLCGSGNGEEKLEKRSEFKYGEEEKERFNRILKHYEGTHNFHNFTTRTKAEDPAAKRYIISFDAKTTVTIDGIEFVKCEVVGQSFMLHQIRKMIGLAVAIIRNIAPESIFDTAFQQDFHMNVPTAPEVGLYLDECLFTSYNSRWKDTHEEVSMKDYADEAEEFKMKFIYSHIASTEIKEGPVALWLHSLNHRNYPDLRGGDSGLSAEKKSSEIDNTGDCSGGDSAVPMEKVSAEMDNVGDTLALCREEAC